MFSKHFCSYCSVSCCLLSCILQLIIGKCFLLCLVEPYWNTLIINQLWLPKITSVQSNQHQTDLSHSPSVYKQTSENRNETRVPVRCYFVWESTLLIDQYWKTNTRGRKKKKVENSSVFKFFFRGNYFSLNSKLTHRVKTMITSHMIMISIFVIYS